MRNPPSEELIYITPENDNAYKFRSLIKKMNFSRSNRVS